MHAPKDVKTVLLISNYGKVSTLDQKKRSLNAADSSCSQSHVASFRRVEDDYEVNDEKYPVEACARSSSIALCNFRVSR
jgi:hypothetical protein